MFFIPFRIAGVKIEIKEIINSPEPKETRAASIGLPIRCESSPFARACIAIKIPERAARKSSLGLPLVTVDECRGIHAYQRSNPSAQKALQRLQTLGG